MKLILILALAIVVLLVWLRSGFRRARAGRGPFVELLMFALAIAGLIGLVLLAGRLF